MPHQEPLWEWHELIGVKQLEEDLVAPVCQQPSFILISTSLCSPGDTHWLWIVPNIFLGGDVTGEEWGLCPWRVSHTEEILASNRRPDGNKCYRRKWNGIHAVEYWGGRQGAILQSLEYHICTVGLRASPTAIWQKVLGTGVKSWHRRMLGMSTEQQCGHQSGERAWGEQEQPPQHLTGPPSLW